MDEELRTLEVKDVAALTGLALPAVYAELNSGRLRGRKVGARRGKWLISRENFRKWQNGDE
jgi:predicted DNA-binding transcriptional regulator AlpA